MKWVLSGGGGGGVRSINAIREESAASGTRTAAKPSLSEICGHCPPCANKAYSDIVTEHGCKPHLDLLTPFWLQ